MKLNKDALRSLSTLGDRELWSALRGMASEHGYTLPESVPKHEDMERIRAALSGAERISLADAARILANYKKGG